MKQLIPFLAIALLFSACCKDHSELIPGQDFIPDNVLRAIEENGQTIYKGFNPPALEGKYLMAPAILVRSNFDDPYLPGHAFLNATMGFSDYDPGKLTLKVTVSEGSASTGEGYGSFITGSGNNFTVYVKVESTDAEGHTVLHADVYSGTVEAGGIRNLQRSYFMIDDNGDPNDRYIEIGNGRLAEDQDGFSQKI